MCPFRVIEKLIFSRWIQYKLLKLDLAVLCNVSLIHLKNKTLGKNSPQAPCLLYSNAYAETEFCSISSHWLLRIVLLVASYSLWIACCFWASFFHRARTLRVRGRGRKIVISTNQRPVQSTGLNWEFQVSQGSTARLCHKSKMQCLNLRMYLIPECPDAPCAYYWQHHCMFANLSSLMKTYCG